jgi:hypothetical protein
MLGALVGYFQNQIEMSWWPARKTDPRTSHAAVERIEPKVKTVKEMTLSLLKEADNRGLTDGELEEIALERFGYRKGDQYRKRRSDLTREHKVLDSGYERTHKGVKQVVWVIAK